MVKEFQEFLLKTNALALAVGVIIGGAVGNAIDRLAYGAVADFVLFDTDTVAPKLLEYAYDFPRGGRRLISRAEGVVATFVAGTQVFDSGCTRAPWPEASYAAASEGNVELARRSPTGVA